MKKIFLTLFVLVGLSTNYAQNLLTIDSLLSVVEQNHPKMNMYDAEINSENAFSKGAKSWDAPEIGTGFFMAPYNPALWNGNSTQSGMGSYMISAKQMFPNTKEQKANQHYLDAVSKVIVNNKESVLNELYAQAKSNYLDWIIAAKKMKLLNEDEERLNFIIQSAQIRYENNSGKLNAYYKAQASLGEIAAQKIRLSNEINQKQISLNTLMNRDKNIVIQIDTSDYVIKNYESIDTNYFANNRSDIKAVEQEIQLDALKLQLEKSKLRPQFGLQYNHMFTFGSRPSLFSLMATVKIPFAPWSARSFKANVEGLKWKQKVFESKKQVLLNDLSSKANSLMANLKSKQQQVYLYEKNILPALQKNYTSIQLAYEQNTEDLFTLLDAWKTLNMSQVEYLNQLQELLQLQVQLDELLQKK